MEPETGVRILMGIAGVIIGFAALLVVIVLL